MAIERQLTRAAMLEQEQRAQVLENKMPFRTKAYATLILTAAYAAPSLAQNTLAPPGVTTVFPNIPDPDGTTAVERLRPAINQKAAMPVIAAAVPATGLARAGALGAEIVRPNLQEGFALGPGTALHVSEPLGFAAFRAVSEKTISLFPVNYRGVPLSKGADVVTVVGRDGTIFFERYRNIPSGVDAEKPQIPAERARELARRDFMELSRSDDLTSAETELEVWVSPDQRGLLAWNLVVATNDLLRPIAIEYWVSAVTGQILRRENAVFSFEGYVTGDVWSRSAFWLRDTRPLGLQRVNLASNVGQTVADERGHFRIPGSGTATFTGRLSGPTAVVRNHQGAALTADATGTPMADIAIHFAANEEFDIAQISAYFWINAGLDFAAPVLVMDEPRLANLAIHVNLNQSCDAIWMPDRRRPYVSFYRAGRGCPNTAYSDVALHEVGHGVDQMNGGIVDRPYSEGFGDAIALINTRQSCIGREFYGENTCLRDAAAVVNWPLPAGSGVYEKAKVYGGFIWELVQQLSKSMTPDETNFVAKQLVLSVAKMNPSTIPKAVDYTFVADDDDGNLATCSRHQAEIVAAALSRSLPVPSPCARTNKPASSAPGGSL